MVVTFPIDDIHLIHHLLMRQIGVPLGDSGIVQRDERQPLAAQVEPTQMFDLRLAKVAVAVVNYDVRVT